MNTESTINLLRRLLWKLLILLHAAAIMVTVTHARPRSFHDSHEESPEQKSVSQRARELFNRQRKRITSSGGRKTKPSDGTAEAKRKDENAVAASVLIATPPKKAKRILGIVSPPPDKQKEDELKELKNPELPPVASANRRSSLTAPLATLFDDIEASPSFPDFSPIPPEGAEAEEPETPKTSCSRRSSIDRFFRNKMPKKTPQCSTPDSVERPESATRRSFSLLKMQTSVTSLNSVIRSHSTNTYDLNARKCERTPSRSSLSIVRQISSSSVKKAASSFLRGLVSGPRSGKNRARRRSDFGKRFSIRRSNRRSSGLGAEGRHILQMRERYNQLKSTIRVLKDEIAELATTDLLMYDAIVCDVTPNCEPISEISKLIMGKVGEEVIEDLDSEMMIKKKFVFLNSGQFTACKYIFFAVDYGTPDSLERTWQDMRFVFHNIIEKAISKDDISSLLLPYLYTGEPKRDQEKVANAAVSSIQHLVQQMGLGNIAKLDIGGVCDKNGCYECYATCVNKLMISMAPFGSDFPSEISAAGDNDLLNTTSPETDDSFELTPETHFHHSLR